MPSIDEQISRVEDIAEAIESDAISVQFGPNGPQWCSDALLSAIADRSRETGRRVHMHLLETRYQRAFADAAYPEGVVGRLRSLGLLSPRLTLAHCVYAREVELDLIAEHGAVIATNPSSNLHLASGIAPIGEAIRRGCRVALGVDASALDEDDDIVREMRLGHFLHGGWGFETTIARDAWLEKTVADGRFANGAPGEGRLAVGAPADILVLSLDRLDRDAVMPVEPIDLVFARATAAHIDRLVVAGREVVREGRLLTVDLDAAETSLREIVSGQPRLPLVVLSRMARSRIRGDRALPRWLWLLLGLFHDMGRTRAGLEQAFSSEDARRGQAIFVGATPASAGEGATAILRGDKTTLSSLLGMARRAHPLRRLARRPRVDRRLYASLTRSERQSP